MQTSESTVLEVERLRQIARDLVAISTLPAVWNDLHLEDVIESLSKVLLSTLELDLVYIRLVNVERSGLIESIHSKRYSAAEQFLPKVRTTVDSFLSAHAVAQPAAVADPFGEGTLRLNFVRFGIAEDDGIVVIGSRRANFPSEHEQLLLQLGANQAAVVVQRQRTEQALHLSEKRFLEFVDAAPAMLWANEPDGSCSFLSSGWYHFTGLNKNSGLGFGWTNAVPPEEREAIIQTILDASAQKSEFTSEHRLLRADGSYGWVIDTGRPRFSRTGEFLGFVGSVLDITNRKQTEDDNARLYEQVRDQDKRKDEFLATLAHELRNPLAPIRTGLALLKLVPSLDATVRPRQIMERQLEHMVRLIDDLLDVSRIASGKVQLKIERLEVRTILEAALELSRPHIEESRHGLFISIPKERLLLDADLIRMAQVVSNLLNNAAKYTPEGGRIELSAAADGNEIAIQVQDNGVGLGSDELPKLFGLFSQVGKTMDRSGGGLGIGLALVKSLVEMHNGSVIAESPGFGLGSSFTVRLPRAMVQGDIEHVREEQGSHSQFSLRRILIVDDNVDAAEITGMLLELSGHTVKTVYNGLDALEVAENFAPDILLLDIGLPDISGYEVARQLRANPSMNDTMFVALTGWGTEDDRRQAENAGFDKHFTKPIKIEDLESIFTPMVPTDREDLAPSPDA